MAFPIKKPSNHPRLPVLSLLILLAAFIPGCALLPKGIHTQKDIEYASINSQSLKLDLFTPKHPVGKLPVLVWIHGGSWYEGDKGGCPIDFLARQNLAIVSINYRLSSEAIFPAQINDCKGAIRWLRANADKYDFDGDHIIVFGVSAGGHLAALLGTSAGQAGLEGNVGGNLEYSSKVQAVCAFYPPTDLDKLAPTLALRTNTNTAIARLVGGTVNENLDRVKMASPVTYVTHDSAPFFLMHGEKDTLVPIEQSQVLYAALKKAGAEVTFETVTGKGHGITAPPKIIKEIFEFLQKHIHDDAKVATP